MSTAERQHITRAALFVEEPHEQIALSEWFGDELSALVRLGDCQDSAQVG